MRNLQYFGAFAWTGLYRGRWQWQLLRRSYCSRYTSPKQLQLQSIPPPRKKALHCIRFVCIFPNQNTKYGKTIGNNIGLFTCCKENGSSTVDQMLVTSRFFQLLRLLLLTRYRTCRTWDVTLNISPMRRQQNCKRKIILTSHLKDIGGLSQAMMIFLWHFLNMRYQQCK